MNAVYERDKVKPTRINKRILIVDDFQDDREMYSHYLTRYGFEVILASDGQEALDKVSQFHPDLILMDLWLPQIAGWEAIRQLRANEKTKQIPIVVLTARAFVSAGAVGCEGCLIKPCRPEDLLVEVLRVLELGEKASGSNGQNTQESRQESRLKNTK